MNRRRLRLVAINLLVFLALAETAGAVAYYARHGSFFYAADPVAPPPLPETARGELSADGLHPYFGPIHRPGVRPETNNIGFGSPQAFPYARRNAEEFLVGIFGGSVARDFCDRGAPHLIAVLKQDPRFAARDVVPLCFGHEGYKQPQQLIILSYFLSLGQEYDLVLNIDGFNEVALGSRNEQRGRDSSMPSPIHLDPMLNLIDQATMTPERVYALARISAYKEQLNRLRTAIERTRSAALHFALERYHAFTLNRYQSEARAYDALPANPPSASVLLLTPPVGSPENVYDDIAANWSAASRLMHDMLAARRVRYVHVLQPNQYFTTRAFSDEEARVALNSGQPFKAAVEAGYPSLVRAAASLAGVNTFVDATTAFDREAGVMYEDDCCHYTAYGNEVLAELIASRIVARAF